MTISVRISWLLLLLAAGVVRASAQSTDIEAQILEARRLVDTQEFERALTMLDQIVGLVERASDDTAKRHLASALELRGRAYHPLGSTDAMNADFRRLLTLQPGYTLPPQAGPRIQAAFDQIRMTVVGTVALTVDPVDAVVEIDGKPVTASTDGLALLAGEHTVTAARAGYQPYSASVTVTPGSRQPLVLSLVRTSAAVSFVTSPPGVEVLINDVKRGESVAGTLPPRYQDVPAALKVDRSQVSMPFTLPDLAPGKYLLQLRKPCYQTLTLSLNITEATDYPYQPMKLEPAVASLTVESSDPEATVYIDGQPRGRAPVTIPDLCEGEHTVDLRSPGGRYQEVVKAQRGGSLRVNGTVRPAFALLSVSGLPEGYRGLDLRVEVQQKLKSTTRIALVLLGDSEVRAAMTAEQLIADSFAFDRHRRPIGTADKMTDAARREVTRKLAEVLDVQGIASITVVGGDTANPQVTVSLLASGASEPDVVALSLTDARSILRAFDVLETSPPLSTISLGISAIDVEDIEGAVVAAVEANGPAARAGVNPGDRIVGIAGQPLKHVADLSAVAEARGEQPLTLSVVDKSDTRRELTIRPVRAVRLVSVLDETLPFNALLAQWRTRLRRGAGDADRPLVSLNLGVAALYAGDFEAARDALEPVKLGEGPGISAATVQYLLGLAYQGVGDLTRARQAWTQAAGATGAVLSNDGGDVAELAKRRLKTLTGTP